MKDGAIISNTGHFNVEIEIPALRQMARREPRGRGRSSTSTASNDGRRIFVLGDGRLINLAAAEGHPGAASWT